MRTKEQIKRDIEYKKIDIKNSEVGFSIKEQEKFKEELIELKAELTSLTGGKTK